MCGGDGGDGPRVVRAVVDDDHRIGAAESRPGSGRAARHPVAHRDDHGRVEWPRSVPGGRGCSRPASLSLRASAPAAADVTEPVRSPSRARRPAGVSRMIRAGEPPTGSPRRAVWCPGRGPPRTRSTAAAPRREDSSQRQPPVDRDDRPGHAAASRAGQEHQHRGDLGRIEQPPHRLLRGERPGVGRAGTAGRSRRGSAWRSSPGLTAFTVTPVPPSSTASARISPVTPALAAQYAASIGRPRVAAAEATARNRPDRGSGRRSSAGTRRGPADTTPPRSTSSTACCWATGTSHSGTPPAITPATASAASSPPQRLFGGPYRGIQRRRVADVGDERADPSASPARRLPPRPPRARSAFDCPSHRAGRGRPRRRRRRAPTTRRRPARVPSPHRCRGRRRSPGDRYPIGHSAPLRSGSPASASAAAGEFSTSSSARGAGRVAEHAGRAHRPDAAGPQQRHEFGRAAGCRRHGLGHQHPRRGQGQQHRGLGAPGVRVARPARHVREHVPRLGAEPVHRPGHGSRCRRARRPAARGRTCRTRSAPARRTSCSSASCPIDSVPAKPACSPLDAVRHRRGDQDVARGPRRAGGTGRPRRRCRWTAAGAGRAARSSRAGRRASRPRRRAA